MAPLLPGVLERIKHKNPMHAKTLERRLKKQPPSYFQDTERFLERYMRFLKKDGTSLDEALNCYLKVCSDVMYEQIRFQRTGRYSCTSLEEAKRRMYGNADVMKTYLHGVLLSQFLWIQHHNIYAHFKKVLAGVREKTRSYLEIGGGHCLYLSEAMNLLGPKTVFDLIDISPTTIAFAKEMIGENRARFFLGDISTFQSDRSYDFVMMGEVLEHVEDPVGLLKLLHALLSNDGCAYVTAPTNAPAMDHLYLFRNAREIREVIARAGFQVIEETSMYAEDVPPAEAESRRITLVFGAWIRKTT